MSYDHNNPNDLALAKIGLIALIDEATGYQAQRPKGELIKMFRNFTPDKEFANLMEFSFVNEMCRVLNINVHNPNDIAQNGKKIHNFLRDILANRKAIGCSISDYMTSMDALLRVSYNQKGFKNMLDRFVSSSKENRRYN